MLFQGDTEGAFSDLLVLEIGDEGTQSCGKYFGDMGATVLKVEPPGGAASRHRGPYLGDQPNPNASLYFWAFNTSKDSITLDLDSAAGQESLRTLAARADVLIEDYPPGYLTERGLGYEELAAIAPRLIVTSVTPFGQSGPYKNWKGSDLVCGAMGGAVNMIGYSDPDTPPFVPQGDIAYQLAGCWAIIGTLVALAARDQSDEGQHVDVSVQEASAFCVDGYDVSPYEYTGEIVGRRDGGANILTEDGKWLVANIASVPDSRWIEFRDWLIQENEGSELHGLDAKEMQSNMPMVRSVIGKLAETRTSNEMIVLGQSFGFTWAAANAPDELMDDEQLLFRGFFTEVHHPELDRTFTYGGPGAVWSEAPWKIRSRPPMLGEDNDNWLNNAR